VSSCSRGETGSNPLQKKAKNEENGNKTKKVHNKG